jgi:DNA helicase-2/ATP-dependent DNA helicase PcrA
MSDPARPSASISARALAARGGSVAGTNAPWLEGLNPEQHCARWKRSTARCLVLAGAGTGKTRVLTTRIAHILGTGRASPGQIMAVTFTNKAAREMKQRIGGMIGSAVEGMPWLGTFHAIGTRILRYHAELAGLKSSFTILDSDDQIRLLKQVIQAENIDEKRWPARQLAAHIDRWKNRGLLPDKVPASDAVFANGRGIELYTAYQERMAVLNAVDFGDLLVKPIKLFTDHPDILADYHRRFKFLLVDEYQDTNVAQYLWLRLLGAGHGRAEAQHLLRGR